MEIGCNHCTACCRGSAKLTPDEAEWLKTMKHPGGWIGTAITDDGWCIYCERGVGCRIHVNKPKFCADYDCRDDVDDVNICRTVRDAAKQLLEMT